MICFLLEFFWLLGVVSLQAQDSSCSQVGMIRSQALCRLDSALSHTMPLSLRTYALQEGELQKFSDPLPALASFEEEFGYFSCQHPLVGVVTQEAKDLEPVQKLLQSLMQEKDPKLLSLAVEEVLAKVLAYRNLEVGMRIYIPTELKKKSWELVEYEVDTVLDLLYGMPAFGLLAQKQAKAPPLLLFRGTDLSLLSKKSWASILCDLDVSGIGWTAFQSAEPQIKKWLEKANSLRGPAKVVGFSLGGALSIYTALLEPSCLCRVVAFNSPGVSKSLFLLWGKEQLPPISFYAAQGDPVSKLGWIGPRAFEMAYKGSLGPIAAHTSLMTAKSPLFLFPIDLEQENKQRFIGK